MAQGTRFGLREPGMAVLAPPQPGRPSQSAVNECVSVHISALWTLPLPKSARGRAADT